MCRKRAQRRLTYQEKRELESLPAKIESLDTEIAELHEGMAQPEYYKQPSRRSPAINHY